MTRKEILAKTIDFDDAINRIVRFEKENSELKEKLQVLNLNGCITIRDLNDNLTKAKVLRT